MHLGNEKSFEGCVSGIKWVVPGVRLPASPKMYKSRKPPRVTPITYSLRDERHCKIQIICEIFFYILQISKYASKQGSSVNRAGSSHATGEQNRRGHISCSPVLWQTAERDHEQSLPCVQQSLGHTYRYYLVYFNWSLYIYKHDNCIRLGKTSN